MGIPLVAGHFFTAQDRDRSSPVAIVNQRFAQEFLRGPKSIGAVLRLQVEHGQPTRDFSVVGVAGDTGFPGWTAR